ncbi:MAG TPA: PilN domain-containing protein [Verrucomicrobiae bacterium]|nr:PilN domain-containing protein [Verrucomicrobiae bacterium]
MKIINLLPKSVSRELQLELIASQILNFWTWLVLSMAVFFTLILGSVFYLRTEIQRIDSVIFEQKEVLSSSNTKELESRVSALNTQIKNIQNLQKQHYYWSEMLTELANILPGDVRVDFLGVDRTTGLVEMAGYARSRESVLQFWSNVKKSEYFRDINFPLKNLERATDASFTFTFYVNPEEIKQ